MKKIIRKKIQFSWLPCILIVKSIKLLFSRNNSLQKFLFKSKNCHFRFSCIWIANGIWLRNTRASKKRRNRAATGSGSNGRPQNGPDARRLAAKMENRYNCHLQLSCTTVIYNCRLQLCFHYKFILKQNEKK